ncbi:hypothetical protein SLA2020_301340 [Shorea laevis]
MAAYATLWTPVAMRNMVMKPKRGIVCIKMEIPLVCMLANPTGHSSFVARQLKQHKVKHCYHHQTPVLFSHPFTTLSCRFASSQFSNYELAVLGNQMQQSSYEGKSNHYKQHRRR